MKYKFRAWDTQNKKMIKTNAAFPLISFDGKIWGLSFANGDYHLEDYTDRLIPMIYTGQKDVNGKEIYTNDLVKYRHLVFETLDAVRDFGVEPQNNWQEASVYPEYRVGVVKMLDGCFVIQEHENITPLYRDKAEVNGEIIDYTSGDWNLDTVMKEFDDYDIFGLEIVGNIYEN